jgi:hypothetical protein
MDTFEVNVAGNSKEYGVVITDSMEARASLAKARAADAGDVVADSLRVVLADPQRSRGGKASR